MAQTEVKIRYWAMEDLEILVHLANNIKISENMMDSFPHPYTSEDGQKFINFAMSGNPMHVFAITSNGVVCGGIGVHPQQDIFRKNMEMGYWLGEEYWGKGIALQAINLIVAYAFENFDISRIFARPYGRNFASQKLLQKAGFILEARLHDTVYKNGQYEDELIYSLRK